MDFDSINNCMSDQQKLSLSAASLSTLTGGELTYDDINNKMSDQQKLSLIASSLTKLGGSLKGIRGRLVLKTPFAGFAALGEYGSPLGLYNDVLGAKQQELVLMQESGAFTNVVELVGEDGNIIPWSDVWDAVINGQNIDIYSVEHLGETVTVNDMTPVFEENPTARFTRMLGVSVCQDASETPATMLLSGLGFIGTVNTIQLGQGSSLFPSGSFFPFSVWLAKETNTGDVERVFASIASISVTSNSK